MIAYRYDDLTNGSNAFQRDYSETSGDVFANYVSPGDPLSRLRALAYNGDTKSSGLYRGRPKPIPIDPDDVAVLGDLGIHNISSYAAIEPQQVVDAIAAPQAVRTDFASRICWYRAMAMAVMDSCVVSRSEHDQVDWDGKVIREGGKEISTEELDVPTGGCVWFCSHTRSASLPLCRARALSLACYLAISLSRSPSRHSRTHTFPTALPITSATHRHYRSHPYPRWAKTTNEEWTTTVEEAEAFVEAVAAEDPYAIGHPCEVPYEDYPEILVVPIWPGYFPLTCKWSPSARSRAAGTVMQGRLFIAGGLQGSADSFDVLPKNDVWYRDVTPPTTRMTVTPAHETNDRKFAFACDNGACARCSQEPCDSARCAPAPRTRSPSPPPHLPRAFSSLRDRYPRTRTY